MLKEGREMKIFFFFKDHEHFRFCTNKYTHQFSMDSLTNYSSKI